MPKYVPNTLYEFQHPYTKIPQHAPHKYERPNYASKTQWAKDESSLDILPEQRRKRIQKVVGGFLYYVR